MLYLLGNGSNEKTINEPAGRVPVFPSEPRRRIDVGRVTKRHVR